MELGWADHSIFFLVGIVFPMMSLMSERVSDGDFDEELLPPKKHLFYTNGLMLWTAALAVFTVVNLSGHDFSLMGFAPMLISDTVLLAVGVFALIYLADLVAGFVIPSVKEKRQSNLENLKVILPVNAREYLDYSFLAVSAGICEEFIYRGFLINYFLQIFSNFEGAYFIAVLIPALVFAVSHLYQGWLAVVKIFVLSCLFGIIFILSESLILVIIIHVLVDLISGLVFMKAYQLQEK
jgi:uncharacterized protein